MMAVVVRMSTEQVVHKILFSEQSVKTYILCKIKTKFTHVCCDTSISYISYIRWMYSILTTFKYDFRSTYEQPA